MADNCFPFSQHDEKDDAEPLLSANPDCQKLDTDDRKSWASRRSGAGKGFGGCVDRFFRISERGSTISTEIAAGFACFLSASVALPVIPAVMSKSGIASIDAITSFCLSSSVACLISGLFGNLPFVLVPSLGMTIFFTYGMVGATSTNDFDERPRDLGADGFGSLSLLYVGDAQPDHMDLGTALSCVLIAGVLMLFLTVTSLVDKGMRLVPNFLKIATIAGIGMQITFIGLESTGLLTNGKLADMLSPDAWPTWAALGGLLLMATMSAAGIRGSIILGMLSVSLLCWSIRGDWPRQLVEVPSLSQSFLLLRFGGLRWASAVPAVATFLAVMLFDCSACLIGLSQQAGIIRSVTEPVPGGMWALMACGVGTCVAGCTGCTPLIISLDSSVGILEGGRTGLTSATTGVLFGLSLFFAPMFGAVPEAASAPVLVLVGSMMMHDVGSIPWGDRRAALSSLLIIAVSPMSRSIADGLGMGTACYLLMSIGALLLSACGPAVRPAASSSSAAGGDSVCGSDCGDGGSDCGGGGGGGGWANGGGGGGSAGRRSPGGAAAGGGSAGAAGNGARGWDGSVRARGGSHSGDAEAGDGCDSKARPAAGNGGS